MNTKRTPCRHNRTVMIIIDSNGVFAGCQCLPIRVEVEGGETQVVPGVPCRAMERNGGVCPRLSQESALAKMVAS
ncbi:MAG: hypothetical protein WCW56_02180 [Candidatus Paceibacterota bacterium]